MNKIPTTDSIAALADFWQQNDLTDFDAELQEVTEPVFQRPEKLVVNLPPNEAQALHALAEARGISESSLVAEWVHEHLEAG